MPTIRRERRDIDQMTKAVAYLASQGHSTDDIKEALRISRNWVFKLKRRALTAGILRRVDVLNHALSEEDLIELRGMRVVADLNRRLEKSGVRVRYCDTGRHGTPADRLAKFGRIAAHHVYQIIVETRAKTIGVAYGSVVAATCVTGLRSACAGKQLPKKHAVTVIAVRGDALMDDENTGGRIAWEMAHMLNGGKGRWISMPGAPPVIPSPEALGSEIAADKLASLFWSPCSPKTSRTRDAQPYLEYLPHWAEWREQLETLDLLITSVGPGRPVSEITRRTFSLASFPYKKLGEHFLGDFASIPVLAATAQDSDRALVAEFERRLVGISTRHVKQTALHKRVVVVCALDPDRAACIVELLRLPKDQRLLTDLLIDEPVAQALARHLPS